MADSSSLLQEQLENQSCPVKLPETDIPKRDFALTEAQRTFIQYHLPRTFALLPVSANCSRLNCTSKALIEDSLTFIERKRGRPEGSTRKTTKAARERKSARIALVSRPSYTSLHRSSLSERSSNEEETERMQGYRQEISVEKPLQISQANCSKEPSGEQGDTCKEVEAKNELQAKTMEVKLEVDRSNAAGEVKNTQKIRKKPPAENKSVPKKTLKDKGSKMEDDEGDVLQTPMKKEGDQQNQAKTQPSNKQLAPSLLEQSSVFAAQRMVLRRLKSHREILPFLQPVDQVRDLARNYYTEIVSPIDLQTIEFKLTTGIYKEAAEFHSDIQLMWDNSKTYNRSNIFMQKITEELENFYVNLLSKPSKSRKKKVIV